MIDSDIDEELDAVTFTFVRRVLATILLPYRLLTSRSAIKAYLTTILFLGTSAILLGVSAVAYLVFYYNYIPLISFDKTLHLQYGLGKYPFATAIIEPGTLISQQPYDVEILLNLPRTPNNLAAGNFMVDVQLLGPHNPFAEPDHVLTSLLGNISLPSISGLSTLSHSRRPAILPYQSSILYLAHLALHLPLHLLGLQDLDANTLRVSVFESVSFLRNSISIPTHVRVELQANGPVTTTALGIGTSSLPLPLQVYSSKIKFLARFQGLRYFVYRYRILSFLLFTALFYGVSILALVSAWSIFSFFFTKPTETAVSIKQETLSAQPESDVSIKQEPEDGDSRQGVSGHSLYDIQSQGRSALLSAPPTQQQYIRTGEAADDEEGTDEDAHVDDEDDDAGDYHAVGRTTGSAIGDSGIGTSMESGHEQPIVRRRSGRASAGRA